MCSNVSGEKILDENRRKIALLDFSQYILRVSQHSYVFQTYSLVETFVDEGLFEVDKCAVSTDTLQR
jgi:hypothetical protein